MPLKPFEQRRKNAGLCIECGTLPLANKYYCFPCAKKIASAMKQLHDERREKGLCIVCGEKRNPNSKSRCSKCLDKKADYNYKTRSRGKRNRKRGGYIPR